MSAEMVLYSRTDLLKQTIKCSSCTKGIRYNGSSVYTFDYKWVRVHVILVLVYFAMDIKMHSSSKDTGHTIFRMVIGVCYGGCVMHYRG